MQKQTLIIALLVVLVGIGGYFVYQSHAEKQRKVAIEEKAKKNLDGWRRK